MSNAPEGYPTLIEEAYIKPIRSVVVVDDEYPTLDEFFHFGSENMSEKVPVDVRERAGKILAVCRERFWIADFHNGQNVSGENEVRVSRHLHQSDLLILDYELDGQGGGGDRAVQVINELAKSSHFNLVVVYTKESNLSKVLANIKLGLLAPDDSLLCDEELEEALGDWELEGSVTVLEQLGHYFDELAYLEYRSGGLKNLPQMKVIGQLFKKKPSNFKFQPNNIAYFFLGVYQNSIKKKLAKEPVDPVLWSEEKAENNWVRTEKVFVTVVNKKTEPEQIPNHLQSALCCWHPGPHRLLISKMRFELDEHGGMAEDLVLGDQYVQAGWYREVRAAETDEEQGVKILNLISRQWNSLNSRLSPSVFEYVKKVMEFEAKSYSTDKGLEKHFGVLLTNENHKDKMLLHFNCFVSCKEVDDSHLIPGHILCIDGDYWLCSTPACDLAPRKREQGWHEFLGNALPFKAVKLIAVKPKKAVEGATGGEFLFMKLNDEPKTFRFKHGGTKDPHPHWEQFFAYKQGRFKDQTIQVARIRSEREKIVVLERQAKVVAQLRYEYALNLLQKLGTNLMRVGLDFITD